MMKFTKPQIKKYDSVLKHIDESLEDDTHDFWSAVFCGGITFEEEIERFADYCNGKRNDIYLKLKVPKKWRTT